MFYLGYDHSVTHLLLYQLVFFSYITIYRKNDFSGRIGGIVNVHKKSVKMRKSGKLLC